MNMTQLLLVASVLSFEEKGLSSSMSTKSCRFALKSLNSRELSGEAAISVIPQNTDFGFRNPVCEIGLYGLLCELSSLSPPSAPMPP